MSDVAARRSALIGATGFIGGNLLRQTQFNAQFHSKNISEARDLNFDLVVCAGVSAAKWWANQNPEEDRRRISSLVSELARISVRKMIVISTVDVYPTISGIDESADCRSAVNHAYGANRLWFEDAVLDLFPGATIVRIGGVFGPGLKKNVIFDLLTDNCLDVVNKESSFQYYNVGRLWHDIELALSADLPLVNFVTEPLPTYLLIDRLFPYRRVGSRAAAVARYDVKTRYSRLFGGPEGYLQTREEVIADLSRFVASFLEPPI